MSGYNNISPVIYTAPQSWIEQQTLRGIGSNRSRLYVDASGDLWGQFENNPPKKIAGLGGAGSSTSTEVPVGAVFQWIGSVAPDGYLMCDGSAIAGGYPKLAALLQGTYGGKTPDFRGRVIIGSVGQTGLPSDRQNFPGSLQLGATGGISSFELTIEQVPPHVHGILEEEAGSHTHTFDIPTHTHALSGSVPGHSHTFDAGGYVGDALVEQDETSADWVPSVGDDTNPTWTNTDLVTGDENWAGTPVAVTGGGTTTGEGGAIDYDTADGGYHDHLTTKDDSSINGSDPDAYTGDGGIDIGNTNDNDDNGNMTVSWDTKPNVSASADTTTGAPSWSGTPQTVSLALTTSSDTDATYDITTSTDGTHDHLEADTLDDDDDAGFNTGGDGTGADLGIDVGGPAGGGGHNSPLGIDWYGSGSWGADTIEIPTNTGYDVETDVAGSHSHDVDGGTTSAGGHNHTTVAAGGETLNTSLAEDDSGSSTHGDFSVYQWEGGANWQWDAPTYSINVDTYLADASLTMVTSVDSIDWNPGEDSDMTPADGYYYWGDHASSRDHRHDATTDNHTHSVDTEAGHTHDIDGDTNAAGTHSHDVTVGNHTHSCDVSLFYHTHEFDMPHIQHNGHDHDFDFNIPPHNHTIGAHAHGLTNVDHTHDIDGLDVTMDDAGWDHTHEFDIPFSRGTHAHDIDIEGHTHTIPTHAHSLSGLNHTHDVPTSNFDHGHVMDETESSLFHNIQYNLEASTSVQNKGIGWVNSMSIGGSATAGGGVTGGETSSSSASAHSHGGYTESTGGREAIIGTEVDPVEVCPPYIAINFIIKHD